MYGGCGEMNRDALSSWFKQEGIWHEKDQDGFIIHCNELSNKTIREIGACNGKLKFGAEIMVVNDD